MERVKIAKVCVKGLETNFDESHVETGKLCHHCFYHIFPGGMESERERGKRD